MLSVMHSIAPLILIVVIGLITGKSGILTGATRKALSDFCYYLGMPALLVHAISSAPSGIAPVHLVWSAYLIPVALIWLAGSVLGRSRGSASIAMASAYGNIITLGLPLSIMQFGPSAAITASLILVVHSPVLFLAAAVHSELSRHVTTVRASACGAAAMASPDGGPLRHPFDGLGRTMREVGVDLATNPIILAIFAGFTMRMTGVGLPPVADQAFALVGQATLPCVLIAMGLRLSESDLNGNVAIAGAISALKLVALPAATWFVAARLLGLPPFETAVITLLCAMPTGTNVYVLASRRREAEAPVAAAVTLSMIASAITVTVVLLALGQPA